MGLTHQILPDQYDPDSRLQEMLDRISGYYPQIMDLDLGRIERLLNDLGSPQDHIPPVIHIAGTNGKGSTLATMRAICEAAGMSCHVLTSPHLVRLNERFVLAGKEMATPEILKLFENIETINNGGHITPFEIMTAAALYAFSREKADVTMIEVGLGGKLDATNVIKQPAISIIMSIAKDHIKFLGDSLTKIAAEKAGIIKQSIPCVIGPQSSEALAAGVMSVFEDEAASRNAPLYRHGHEWSFDPLPDGFILHTGDQSFDLPLPNLAGAHQIGNAATATMAAHILENKLAKPLTLSAIEHGITHTRWPGRLQKLQQGPLIDTLPEGWEIWIDGGHNDGCAHILADQLKRWNQTDNTPTHIILGMLNTKDPKEFASILLPHAASTITITIPDQPCSMSGEELQTILLPVFPSIKSANNLKDAVNAIKETDQGETGRILITGSLYLMGTILADHR